MNKIRYIVAIIGLIILTGCVRYETEMKINDDKSVDLHMKYAMEIEFVDNSDKDDDYIDENLIINDNYEEKIYEDEEEEIVEEDSNSSASMNVNSESYKFLRDYGYSVEDFSEQLEDGSTSSGVIIYKKFSSLDEITSDSKVTIDFTKLFTEKEGFDDSKIFYKEKEKYNADFIFDFKEQEGSDDVDLEKYASMFNLKYTIIFSDDVKSITSNANEISKDGKTLTWNFTVGKINEVKFNFSYDKQVSKIDEIIIYICLGTIGISILTIIIVSLTKIGKKKKIEIEE